MQQQARDILPTLTSLMIDSSPGRATLRTILPLIRKMRWCGVLLLSLLSLNLDPSWANDKVEATLIVEDVLARPGTPATLEARLVRQSVLGTVGLGGEPIVFEVQGEVVGTAMTGGDGRAFLEYTTHMRGNHLIVARVEASPRVHPTEGRGILGSWERRRPILIVDMVALIQRMKVPILSVPLPVTALGTPEADAALVLRQVG
ncbi:MAG: hypothetical protein D6704_12030, partial [Nitrospirae bacterium]